MWKQTKIGQITVEYESEETRARYATIEGNANSCQCAYGDNYRSVRREIFPPNFLALLSEFGVNFEKEVGLTHVAGDNQSERSYGFPAIGNYAFVGRIVAGEPDSNRAANGPFDFWVGTCDRTTRTIFGNKDDMLDLEFYVGEVPRGAETPV
jgi:hypothetical protein